MPSVRSLILLAVGIFVLSLVIACLSLLSPPDSGGMGRDSYGITRSGFRALYEVLDELNIPVERTFHPPHPNADIGTLVFISPNHSICGTEPKYLHRLIPWVEQGGTIVIAQGVKSFQEKLMEQASSPEFEMPTIWESLGLEDVIVETSTPTSLEEVRRMTVEELVESYGREEIPSKTVEIEAEGTFATTLGSVQQLELPGDETMSISWSESNPVGTLTFNEDEETPTVVAAEFQRGNGRIIAVASSSIFSNVLLAESDNSVFAVRVLSQYGEPVVFDEFYHGLGVRGNSLYLLTRPGYAALALGLLLFVLLASWREAVLLGPCLDDEEIQRRDISEYITAMGQFFSKGKRARPFLAERLRAGVVRQLNVELALPPENQDEDLIITSLARRNPERADLVKKSLEYVDTKLASRKSWSKSETVDIMRRMTKCL